MDLRSCSEMVVKNTIDILIENDLIQRVRFQRIDVPFSMVLEWCNLQFGRVTPPMEVYWSAHKQMDWRWAFDGGNFYFHDMDDAMAFALRWS